MIISLLTGRFIFTQIWYTTKRLADYRTIIHKNIYKDLDYSISQYKKVYNTDKSDKYDLYEFTWECPGKLKIKNYPKNAFFSMYRLYVMMKGKRD
ncbi:MULTISPECIES: hypothetical protein [Acidiplasma]|jgi:hypothetical protein|uniref:Uncharacterized protein n=2 Tax=Acidiplasma TaxID=507753 RepID=A0A0Q0XGD4_9ARCH|nr:MULTISPECIES: hypothetical protein [Acidiplasma]KJE49620.1 hypothetical protein TZ01_00365 [Acidiplasma sp. MBA-1]KPV46767.1 hypothetical protein SE19_04085 [Acidiplasma aeolicum]KQB33672.1 hypothetical protein AOG55_02375 [Acidiplasma cupricumulans]KQB34227.1 hypothetical protein AOG54_05415 [Acidiplasma aeolicum]WMT55831.1 MAG: hypothetical protein RE470_04095 [Acidiplasma sp.]